MDVKKISEYVKNSGVFTIPRLQAEFSLTYRQADELVKKLVAEGRVKPSHGLEFVYVKAAEEDAPERGAAEGINAVYDPEVVEYIDDGGGKEDEEYKRKTRADRSRRITTLALSQRRYLRASTLTGTEPISVLVDEGADEDDDDEDEDDELDAAELALGEEYLSELRSVTRKRFERVAGILKKLKTLEKFDRFAELPRCDGYDDESVAKEYCDLLEEYGAVLLMRIVYAGGNNESYDGEDMGSESGWFTPKKILYFRLHQVRYDYYLAWSILVHTKVMTDKNRGGWSAKERRTANERLVKATRLTEAKEKKYKAAYEAFYGVKLEGEHVPERLEDLSMQDMRVRALRLCIERGEINEDEVCEELALPPTRGEECVRWMILNGYAEELEDVTDDDGDALVACRPVIEMNNFNCLLNKNRK